MRNTRAFVIACVTFASGAASEAQELPVHLRDRGTGVAMSQFGTYVRQGELLVYPFFEWYYDSNFEYKPSELAYGLEQDFRGKYRASEGLLFLGYGLTSDLALEFEAAVISARLEKSPQDPSTMPAVVKESGLGDVEAQIRWRFRRETRGRPELFSYFETVFPFQKRKKLIGTPNYELKLGIGAIRSGPSGTWTLRAATEYNAEERKFEPGEYAIEYLKRLTPAWRVVALLEIDQLDEVALITEAQWGFLPRAVLKVNNGLGLTPNATDFAPEVGIMFSF
jgi:hypothetical protein